jgi:hypothetical protein
LKRRSLAVVIIVLIMGGAFWLYRYLAQALSGVQ